LYNGKQQHTVLGTQNVQMQIVTNATKCLGYRLRMRWWQMVTYCGWVLIFVSLLLFFGADNTYCLFASCRSLQVDEFSFSNHCSYFSALAMTIACLLLADKRVLTMLLFFGAGNNYCLFASCRYCSLQEQKRKNGFGLSLFVVCCKQ